MVFRQREEGSDDMVTIHTVVHHARDEVARVVGDYTVDICHVRGWHGHGFMARVRSKYGGTGGSSAVKYGKDQAAWNQALRAGEKMAEGFQRDDAAGDLWSEWISAYATFRRMVGKRDTSSWSCFDQAMMALAKEMDGEQSPVMLSNIMAEVKMATKRGDVAPRSVVDTAEKAHKACLKWAKFVR